MVKKHKIERSIQACLEHVVEEQQSDGGFLSLTSSDRRFESAEKHTTVFYTALVLQSLAQINRPELVDVRAKAANFLKSQACPDGSYNYWARGSGEQKKHPYPNDLDDTVCVLTALHLNDPQSLDGKALAQIVKILTKVESRPGGPYFTWLTPAGSSKAWRDVDLAVNANVAYFLSLLGANLPALGDLTDEAIEAGNISSPYYYGFFPLCYFISRFSKSLRKDELIKGLLEKQRANGFWGNPLKTSLALLSLETLSFLDVENAINNLASQPVDLLCAPHRFGVERVDNGHIFYSGASALTASFCAQALNGYLVRCRRQAAPLTDETVGRSRKKILRLALARAEIFDERSGSNMSALLTEQAKTDEVVLLPHHFSRSLKSVKRSTPNFLVGLGHASLWGWLAYSIYDDFLDEEGEPERLPLSNLAFREAVVTYISIFGKNNKLYEFFNKTMDMMEAANIWEVSQTRLTNGVIPANYSGPNFGDYKVLAQKSAGHMLGPLLILLNEGLNESSRDFQHAQLFFEHYLVAKQLNDDAHDWYADLSKGHVNSVGAMILAESSVEGPVENAKPALEQVFSRSVLFKASDLILEHLRLADGAILKCKMVRDKNFLQNSVHGLRQAAHKAKEQGRIVNEFLKSYNN